MRLLILDSGSTFNVPPLCVWVALKKQLSSRNKCNIHCTIISICGLTWLCGITSKCQLLPIAPSYFPDASNRSKGSSAPALLSCTACCDLNHWQSSLFKPTKWYNAKKSTCHMKVKFAFDTLCGSQSRSFSFGWNQRNRSVTCCSWSFPQMSRREIRNDYGIITQLSVLFFSARVTDVSLKQKWKLHLDCIHRQAEELSTGRGQQEGSVLQRDAPLGAGRLQRRTQTQPSKTSQAHRGPRRSSG